MPLPSWESMPVSAFVRWALRKAYMKCYYMPHIGSIQYLLAHNLRDIGCVDQGQLMTYMFKANKLHQALQDSLEKANKKRTPELEKAFCELRAYLRTGLRRAILQHSGWAQKVFQNTLKRSRYALPRCGVKTIAGDSIDNAEVVSLWGTEGYENKRRCKLKENTATLQVFSYPRDVYIQNNIPSAVLSGKYKNNRIDTDLATKYAQKKICRFLHRDRLLTVDDAWLDCWIPDNPDVAVPKGSVYKSTLVVPIALRADSVTEIEAEFKQQWRKGKDLRLDFKHLGHNIDNDLFCVGFFCVDTPVIGYFDEKLDKELGYFIADLLYTYFFTYHLHSRLSDAYIACHELGLTDECPDID